MENFCMQIGSCKNKYQSNYNSCGLVGILGGGGGGGEGGKNLFIFFFQNWFTYFTLLHSNFCHLIEFGQLSFGIRVQHIGS